jgi:hypothetical protein
MPRSAIAINSCAEGGSAFWAFADAAPIVASRLSPQNIPNAFLDPDTIISPSASRGEAEANLKILTSNLLFSEGNSLE